MIKIDIIIWNTRKNAFYNAISKMDDGILDGLLDGTINGISDGLLDATIDRNSFGVIDSTNDGISDDSNDRLLDGPLMEFQMVRKMGQNWSSSN